MFRLTRFRLLRRKGDDFLRVLPRGGYDIQFVGRDFSPEFSGVIEVAWGRGKRTTLPHGQYKLTSYRYRESLKLEFSGTSDPSQPPAFVLVVAGETATLEVDGQTIHGSFGWDG